FYARNMPGLTPSFDIDETEQLVDADWDQATGLVELGERFQASQWAQRVPVMIEAAVETSAIRWTLRGGLAAVCRTGGDADTDFDPAATWELVDWKTGRIPPDREMPQRSLQLAIYRLAWSRLHNIPLENITGRFVYIAHGVEKTPHDFASEKE